jgi:hypothetical protein
MTPRQIVSEEPSPTDSAPRDAFTSDSAPRPRPSITFASVVVLKQLDSFKKRLFLKPNLYNALRELRDKEQELPIWIDAVCINQQSQEEKNMQVPNIAKIYSDAGRVCIWLGSSDNRTDRAMQFVSRIVKEYDAEGLIVPEYVQCWSDLIYLMRKSWFSRRWIIQELALAKEAVVRCGGKEVHWRDFADSISLFTLHFEKIRQLLKDDKHIPIAEYRTITDLNPIGAKILVDEISNAFLRGADGRLYEPMKGLEELVSTLATFDTSDPRDTINSLLNIAKETCPFSLRSRSRDSTNPPPKPSYSHDLTEVYTEFVRWVVKTSQSLDIICRAWALPERKEKANNGMYEKLVVLPSWVRVAPESTHGNQMEGYNGRKNGDSFVGMPGSGCYNACHGLSPQVRFGMFPETESLAEGPQAEQSSGAQQMKGAGKKRKSAVASGRRKRRAVHDIYGSRLAVDTEIAEQEVSPLPGLRKERRDEALYVRGFKLSTVTFKTDPIPDGVIPAVGLKKLGWKRTGLTEYNAVPDRVWRTLVADKGPEGKNPPSWYHRACLRCLVHTTPNGHINTQDLLNNDPPKIIRNYLKRVQAVTWNRVVLEADNGEDEDILVGIGPPKTEINDIVCILFGCSVPCILRPHNDGEWYELIGEAYIYGKMDGEAVSNLTANNELDSKTQEFRIL